MEIACHDNMFYDVYPTLFSVGAKNCQKNDRTISVQL
jgi:hypothetical protein